MPCRWSHRRQASNDAAPDAKDWKTIRKANLRLMRKQTRAVVLLMALMEAIRVGPVALVYAGREDFPAPGENDFGISYTVGYFLSWLYVCAFVVVFVPLFSWWVPKTTSDDLDKPSTTQKVADYLKKFNLILLPIAIGVCLTTYVWYTVQALTHVDSRSITGKMSNNTRKSWIVRAMLLFGIALSLSLGYGAFQILEEWNLARVKTLEYAIIVVPIQINFGMLFGTIMQYKMEKRIAMKTMKVENGKMEVAIADEKVALLEV